MLTLPGFQYPSLSNATKELKKSTLAKLMNRMRIAITGAGGQIGSVLVRRMIKLPGIDIVAICRNNMTAGLIYSLAPGCNIRIGSITEEYEAGQLLGDCDIIINCALAMIKGNPKRSYLLNRIMIDNFRRLGNLKSLIHFSSISVYGLCQGSNRSGRSEFERPRPDSDYGRSKLDIERYIISKFSDKKIKWYIFRLGNVYGAKMDRSRQIIDLAQNPHFLLPFDGELPSNSVHVEHLTTMIIGLLSASVPSGIYNVANKLQTWRQVFDWHTQATGLLPVKGMPPELSEHLRDVHHSTSIRGDISRWVRSLPLLSLIKYPAIFDTLFRISYLMPQSLAGRLATMYKRLNVERELALMRRGDSVSISPVYFSDAMPGTYLEVPMQAMNGRPLPEDLSRQLRDWYRRFSEPTWLS